MAELNCQLLVLWMKSDTITISVSPNQRWLCGFWSVEKGQTRCISIRMVAKYTLTDLCMDLITCPSPPADHLSTEAIYILIHQPLFVLCITCLAAKMKAPPSRKLAPINPWAPRYSPPSTEIIAPVIGFLVSVAKLMTVKFIPMRAPRFNKEEPLSNLDTAQAEAFHWSWLWGVENHQVRNCFPA